MVQCETTLLQVLHKIHILSSSLSNLYRSEIQHFKSPITTGLTARLLSLEQ